MKKLFSDSKDVEIFPIWESIIRVSRVSLAIGFIIFLAYYRAPIFFAMLKIGVSPEAGIVKDYSPNSFFSLAVLAAFAWICFFGYFIFEKILLYFLNNYYVKNKKCEHGIRGGKTNYSCKQCFNERIIQTIKEDKRKMIIDESENLRKSEIARLEKLNFSNKEFLIKLNPYKFEDTIAQMYSTLGYKVKQTPYSNDGGKDIVLFNENHKYLVECKRFDIANKVGRGMLMKFNAAISEERAKMGFFVTTSYFSQPAIQYANKFEKIKLIDGDALVELMNKAYPENFNFNKISVMCKECGDVVSFTLNSGESTKICKNGHVVNNLIEFPQTGISYPIQNGDIIHPLNYQNNDGMRLGKWFNPQQIGRDLIIIGIKILAFAKWYFKTMTTFSTRKHPLTFKQDIIRVSLIVVSMLIFYLLIYLL